VLIPNLDDIFSKNPKISLPLGIFLDLDFKQLYMGDSLQGPGYATQDITIDIKLAKFLKDFSTVLNHPK
jgi:hypothetical protein